VEDDRSSRSGLFPTGFPQAELPPLTTTEFIAQDQGQFFLDFQQFDFQEIPIQSLFALRFIRFRRVAI
jgi:hypothetical protein